MQQGPKQFRTALSHVRHCAPSAFAAASSGQPPQRSPRCRAALGQLDMIGGSDHLPAAALRAQVQAASEGAAQGSVGATLPRPINPLAAGAPPRGAGVSQLRRRRASQATAIRALSARCTFLELQAEQRERQRRADHSNHREMLRLLCRESLVQHQTLNTLLVSLREGEDVVASPQPRLVTDHRWINIAPQPRRSEPPRGSRSRSRSPAARSAPPASRVEAELAPPPPLVLRPNPRWGLPIGGPRPGTAGQNMMSLSERGAVLLRRQATSSTLETLVGHPLWRQGVPIVQPVTDPRDQATSSPSEVPQDGEHHVED